MPRAEVVARALKEIQKGAANYEYFFSQLTSPEWIEPLFNAGMFQHPYPPEREGDSISFPFWPESRYLARVAASAPELVLDVVLKMQSTDNVRVHEDLVDAVLAMPADLAAEWAKKEVDWMQNQNYLYFLLPERLGKLVSHLSQGRQGETALSLARSLLAVFPDPRPTDEADEMLSFLSREPRARFDQHFYEQILKKHMPDLVKAAGIGALKLLCDLLSNAVRFAKAGTADEETEDYSYIWRPAIEDHAQNRGDDLRKLLVSAVRDAGKSMLEIEGNTVLDTIEKQKPKVFQRMGLYLRQSWPEIDQEGTLRLVVDAEVFEDTHLHHEYFHLLRKQFGSFPPQTKKAYLDMVAAAREAEEWRQVQEEQRGQPPTDEEFERYRRKVQYQKLWPIQEFLEQEWQQRFERLKKEFGKLPHPDFHYYSGGATWVGPTSPKSVEKLRSMGIVELISFLRTWEPTPEPMTPSLEGLGRALTALVASEPDRFAAESTRFKELDPTYVRAFLSGLHEAKGNATFTWSPVLDLCRWVIDQPREIPGRERRYANMDPGWVWARKAIARLLSQGYETGPVEIPFDLRSATWQVLEPLTDDPDPTPEDESRKDGSPLDPENLSINSVRGEAMHAGIQYALWVRRCLEKEPNGEKRIQRGFQEMPEVKTVLDKHLDLTRDSSLAIRSVYGRWFPWLVLLDPYWAAKNLSNIFPSEDGLQIYRDTSWETYLIFCDAYDPVYDLLKKEYARAVERIGTTPSDTVRLAEPDERLSEHLMCYYWRGKVDLDEPADLLPRFCRKASEPLRSHALEFVGRTLQRTTGRVPDQVLKRFRILWQRRIDEALIQEEPYRIELPAFGWWFSSGKFGDEWAMEQLERVLELAASIEPDRLVAKRLAELAALMPLPVVKCLGLMVESDREGWSIEGWKESARVILSIAIQSDDLEAKRLAIDVVHRLGALGHLDFRDLISGARVG